MIYRFNMGNIVIGYKIDLKHSLGGYDSEFIRVDELQDYEPKIFYKVIGIVDVYEEPENADFHMSEDWKSSLTDTEKIIL